MLRAAALSIAVCVAGCAPGPEDLDKELRAIIDEHQLGGDPARGIELAAVDDPLARLGRELFFAKSLSGGFDVACVSCHHPLLAGGDGLSLSVGVDTEDADVLGVGRRVDLALQHDHEPSALPGPNVPRNAPTTFNAALYRKALFHGGRVRTGEGEDQYDDDEEEGIVTPDSLFSGRDLDAGDTLLAAQSRFPITSTHEMLGFEYLQGGDRHNVRKALAERIGGYGAHGGELGENRWPEHFRDAFGEPDAAAEALVSFANISRAMAAYQESQRLLDNAWFAYVKGDRQALSEPQKRGAVLFYRGKDDGGRACAGCHAGDFLTDEAYHNLAFPQFGPGKDKLKQDYGRKRVTRRDDDKYAFRTPSLLNVEVTGPYGHTGAFMTLAQVIDHHVDPEKSLAAYDFELKDLPQFAAGAASYPRAEESSRLAYQHPNRARVSKYTDEDVALIIEFLLALTDPCVKSEACLRKWIPEPSTPSPDATRLIAKFPNPPQLIMPMPRALFTESSSTAGIDHVFLAERPMLAADTDPQDNRAETLVHRNQHLLMSSGLAAGDVNHDGYPDLLLLGGKLGRARLYLNRRDGTFADASARSGLSLDGNTNGATFAEMNGDGHLDLIVGGQTARPTLDDEDNVRQDLYVYFGNGDGSFTLATQHAGIPTPGRDMASTAFGDYDLDGDLDLLIAHWNLIATGGEEVHLWKNRGDGRFAPANVEAGVAGSFGARHFSFAPSFSDINGDGWPDLLIAGDFETSQVFVNEGGRRFRNATNPFVINDENGMGSAIGDYDNDGDLDWFVSSVFDPAKQEIATAIGTWGSSGNRLYRNAGDGTFEDVTDAAGVREGFWGWGSCFADFDNDGDLDLFHVNGFGYADSDIWREYAAKFMGTPARLYESNGDGTFTERAAALGIADTGEGRAVSCLDYDRDGDVDVVIVNHHDTVRIYENRLREQILRRSNFLGVRLSAGPGNPRAAGAKIAVHAGGSVQIRELRIGSNYLSQNPAEAHFGLGGIERIDKLVVHWPDRARTVSEHADIAVNQWIELPQPAAAAQTD